jgi:hypothetical protein
MAKSGQTPPSPSSGAHLLDGLLSKEPVRRAIELAFSDGAFTEPLRCGRFERRQSWVR